MPLIVNLFVALLPTLTTPLTPAFVPPILGRVILAVELESVLIFKLLKAVLFPITWRVIVPVPLSIVRSSLVPSKPSIEVVNTISPSSLSTTTVPLIFTRSLKVISPAEVSSSEV